jgi:hypothetical protein
LESDQTSKAKNGGSDERNANVKVAHAVVAQCSATLTACISRGPNSAPLAPLFGHSVSGVQPELRITTLHATELKLNQVCHKPFLWSPCDFSAFGGVN